MSLSCECDYWDGEGEYFRWPESYTLYWPLRSRRCCSCGTKLTTFDIVTKFERARPPRTEVEERIHGYDDIELAPWYMCEACSDLMFSLRELGFCFEPCDDMRELLREYHELGELHGA